MEVSRYWHANCAGIDIDFTTTGEHKPETADLHEFPFPCPICGKRHVALEVTKAERDILKEQESGGGKITHEMVDRLEEETLDLVGENDVLNVDVLQVYIGDEDAFDFVGTHCSWCDNEINVGDEAYLWGEPAPRGRYVSINTFDNEECLKARLESWREKQGKSAMLIKFRG